MRSSKRLNRGASRLVVPKPKQPCSRGLILLCGFPKRIPKQPLNNTPRLANTRIYTAIC